MSIWVCSIGVYGACHIGKGVAADPEKIKVMVQWPKPKNIQELRGFLGLTSYYRRFVKGYGTVARALTDLIKKDQFRWN